MGLGGQRCLGTLVLACGSAMHAAKLTVPVWMRVSMRSSSWAT